MMKTMQVSLTAALLAGVLGAGQALAAPVLLYNQDGFGGTGGGSPGLPVAGGSLTVFALHLSDFVDPNGPSNALIQANCLGCDVNLGFGPLNDVDLVYTPQNSPNFANFVDALTPRASDIALGASLGLPPTILSPGISAVDAASGVGSMQAFGGFDFSIPAGFAVTEVRLRIRDFLLTPDVTSYRFEGNISIYGEALAVPEPSTWILLVLGLAALGFRQRLRALPGIPSHAC
jgi:hypothetical protein